METGTPQECRRCVMRQVDDPELTLADGLCNHCRRYEELYDSRVTSGVAGLEKLDKLVEQIKRSGKRCEYDCVIGVSGGVDSTFVAWHVKRLGLRPLAVHVDNGWNSETAVANIERVLERLSIDLCTEVLVLDEFYDLQRSFLYGSTPDGDIPADHAIQAVLWKVARKNRIKYIISGMNFRTEAISVPTWSYGHSDWKYIRAVHSRFGRRRLRSYPHFGLLELAYTVLFRRVRIVSILNYIDYNRSAAMDVLQNELGWISYGGKHYESIFTRFYQGYLLPRKFGIDKRRGHLSDLINSGQISRTDALVQLETSDYGEILERHDRELFCKKLELSETEFAKIMATPVRSFRDYPNNFKRVQWLRRAVNDLRRRGFFPQ